MANDVQDKSSRSVRKRNQHVVGVLTIDDQAVFRRVAEDVIDVTPGFEPVGRPNAASEGVAAVDRLRPQLVLLDVRMPGIGGIEAARRITSAHPDTVVVLISIEEPDEFSDSARGPAPRRWSANRISVQRSFAASGPCTATRSVRWSPGTESRRGVRSRCRNANPGGGRSLVRAGGRPSRGSRSPKRQTGSGSGPARHDPVSIVGRIARRGALGAIDRTHHRSAARRGSRRAHRGARARRAPSSTGSSTGRSRATASSCFLRASPSAPSTGCSLRESLSASQSGCSPARSSTGSSTGPSTRADSKRSWLASWNARARIVSSSKLSTAAASNDWCSASRAADVRPSPGSCALQRGARSGGRPHRRER